MKIEAPLAVHAHRLHRAYAAEEEAREHREAVESRARDDDFPVKAWRRTREMLTTSPEELETVERHASVILLSIRAALSIDAPAVFDSVHDEDAVDRLQRLRDEGYFAAVMDRPCDGDVYRSPADRAAWVDGWHAFQADLAEFNRALAVSIEMAGRGGCIVEDRGKPDSSGQAIEGRPE